MNKKQIAIFPLHSVLFPGGALPLRIFESRYLDMISQCMRNGDNFGICLISEGSEVGNAPQIHPIGTLAEISYFQQLKDGCLGITVRGLQRFRILSSEVRTNQLTVAEVELLPKEEPLPLPDDYQFMVELLQKIFEQLGHPFISLPKHYDNASWVGARMTELLPIKRDQKQEMLEICDPQQRLERLVEILKEGDYL
jgi:hypothetical protein